MTEKIPQQLNGVSETLFITLYTRALETQRPGAYIEDQQAVAMVRQIDYDFERVRLHGHDEVALIMRVKKFDQYACDFLARNPKAVVVHIGCGLDTRFDRVDNGQVEWFDLDMPPVIDLRRKLMVRKEVRYHMIDMSVFEDAWQEEVAALLPHPFLFLAEGVFPYFRESQIRGLVVKLLNRFPGSEMVFDALTPFAIQMNNFQLAFSRMSARMHWGLKHGRDLEGWHPGIQLLDEWFFFDEPEPRMSRYRWMGHVPLLGRSTGVFHYQLGRGQQ